MSKEDQTWNQFRHLPHQGGRVSGKGPYRACRSHHLPRRREGRVSGKGPHRAWHCCPGGFFPIPPHSLEMEISSTRCWIRGEHFSCDVSRGWEAPALPTRKYAPWVTLAGRLRLMPTRGKAHSLPCRRYQMRALSQQPLTSRSKHSRANLALVRDFGGVWKR